MEAELPGSRTNEGQMMIDEEVKALKVHAFQHLTVWKWAIEMGDERAESAAQEPLYHL